MDFVYMHGCIPGYFISLNEDRISGIMLTVKAMVGLPFMLLNTFLPSSLQFLNEDLSLVMF